jgi:hypothetical protein
LDKIPRFKGVGVYALYYRGDHELYRPIVAWNGTEFRMPLYVGKAVSKGTRKGKGVIDDPNSDALRTRLLKHRWSIGKTSDLDPADFYVRYLRTMAVFVPLCESGVIGLYKPVWNVVLDGFGNNAQGSGRNEQERSGWDTVHPGRPYAAILPPNATSVEEFRKRVIDHVAATTSEPKLTV